MTSELSRDKRSVALIGDGDLEARLVARAGMAQLGLEVIEAETGRDAMELFLRYRPDLVLLDIELTGIDCFSVCDAIRHQPAGAEVPVVIAAKRDDVEAIRRAYDAGASDFLTKPIRWALAAERLRYILRGSQALASVRESEEMVREAQRLARVGTWHLDLATGEVTSSEETRRLFGIALGDGPLDQRALFERIEPSDREGAKRDVEACATGNGPLSREFWVRLPDATRRVLDVRADLVRDFEGQPVGLAGTFQDVTQRKHAEEQVRYLAYHDTLTGLPNRRCFKDRLTAALESSAQTGARGAILFLDLDGFKRINDTLGHEVGDLLLQQVAERIKDSIRLGDCLGRPDGREESEGAVSRFGGDEFTVLLGRIGRPDDAAVVAERILQKLAQPFSVGAEEVVISGSIGIALWPSNGSDVGELLRCADTAMYFAKERYPGNYHFYADAMTSAGRRKLSLEASLRKAIDRDEFELHYQPKVCLRTGRVTGVEALLRWQAQEHGKVGPAEFIPIAEQTGLIEPIGRWCRLEACRQQRAWIDAGLRPIAIALNLSSRELESDSLAREVEAALREFRVDPRHLEFEITESMLMRDEARALRLLQAIRDLGASVSLDDFGTGYSSLTYLKRFRVDCLKIDCSFVRDMLSDSDEMTVAEMIISIGHVMRMKVVAEGVETEEQRRFLADRNCDEMQGYLFSPPVPAAEVRALIEDD